jgi:hypothetical protein
VKKLLTQLATDYPAIAFKAGKKFYWSPKGQTVFYDSSKKDAPAQWALVHELSHGILGHKTYTTDFELLQLEVDAWHTAKQLAKQYKLTISEDHIQDCLDTYRDWLHARSKCPACGDHGLQEPRGDYECINCRTSWHVSTQRFCRAYRKVSRVI